MSLFKTFLLISLINVNVSAYAESDANRGAQVVNDNCGRCHNLRPVQTFSTSDWAVILLHMRERAHLTGIETASVLAFYTSLQPSEVNTTGPMQAYELSTVADPARGRELANRFACQACHVMAGGGGTLGPKLDGVVRSKGEVFVRDKILNPQSSNPTSSMPKIPLSNGELDALIAYLKSLD